MAPHNAAPLGGLVAALLATACGGGPVEHGGLRPSVVLIVADSLHARHLGAWGHVRATSPRIDALAADGVRFERALSQSSWTLASVATLFTSLEQERHGLRALDQTLPDELSTLAELFAAGGWRTQAVVQTPVLASARGLDRGFERYQVLAFGNDQTERAVDLGLRAFETAAEEPLFLYVHLAPPHMPYQPPEPFCGRFSAGLGGAAEIDGSIPACRGVHELGLAPDHPDVVRLAALYDEHVAYADETIGRLVDGLEERAPNGDLLVVVTSDHGEAFLQHGAQGHNTQVHTEMVHVPLLVVGRGRARVPPGVVTAPVSLLDLLPTLVELCDLPAARQLPQGRSLSAALRGEPLDLPRRPLFLSSRYKRRFADMQLGLLEGELKLVLQGGPARAELYDLAADPGEERDLAQERPDDAARLELRLRSWYAARREDAPRSTPSTDSPEVEAALRALGYGG